MPTEAQQLTTLSYADFTGGENSALPATALADNEFQKIKNFEFNFNKLVTRGGLSAPLAVLPASIKGVHWDEGSGEYLVVLNNKDAYHITVQGVATKVGSVVGSQKPVFCEYDGRIFVATGGKLQYFDYTDKVLTTITTSYNCDNVFERFGRVVITKQGDDNVYYSAIGNPYVTTTTETKITDSQGRTTTTSSETKSGTGGEASSETTTTTSTKIEATTNTAKTTYYSGAYIDDYGGASKGSGTSGTQTQSYKYSVTTTYKDDEETSKVYKLNDVQCEESDIANAKFDSIALGAEPVVTGYTEETSDSSDMKGAVYRDVKQTSGNIDRTYYLDKTFVVDGNKVFSTFKVVRTRNSSGTVTASVLSVPYVRIELNSTTDADSTKDDAVVTSWKKTTVNITGGTKTTYHRCIVNLSSDDSKVSANIAYQDVSITKTKTSTSSKQSATGLWTDSNGYKVGDTYSGATDKTITVTINNDDGTTTTYATVINKTGKVTKITRTVVETTHTESSSSSTSSTTNTITDTIDTTEAVDNGSAIVTTTTEEKTVEVDANKQETAAFSIALTSATTTTTNTDASTVATTTTVDSGWDDDSNDDSTAKWTEVGYKDNGDILKVLPISGDVAVFKTNGRVYTISNEFPDWTISQVAEHTDALNAEAIVNVGKDVAFMSNKGIKTLTTTAVYGNFTTDELARKINRSICESIHEPMLFNLVRKRQLIIVPDTSTDEKRKHCYCFQYDIGAGVELDFAYPIYDMQDTENGVVIASDKCLYRWSFDYADDNGTDIEQEIVSKKYASTNRIYTRMVDIGVNGETGKTVTMKWANKTINYAIPDKRRMINVFSVCRDSVFGLYTKAKISLEYIKLYIFEQ